MQDALTYKAEDLRIDRAKVSPDVWTALAAASNDPEGYTAADILYLDCELEISFDLDEDGGCDWDVDNYTLSDGTAAPDEVSTAIFRALCQQMSDAIEAACVSASGVSWHQSTPWNGEWRAEQ